MNISDASSILNTEKVLERTPLGRPITEYAKNALIATLDDTKNWSFEVMRCLNCGFICSALLFEEGCKNCGSKDMTMNIKTTKGE